MHRFSVSCFCAHYDSHAVNQIDLMRQYSQSKFLTHDAVAYGLFNEAFNSGTGSFSAWEPFLLNTYPVLELMLQRMKSDHENQPVKLRKPFSARDIDTQLKLDVFKLS